MNIKNIWLVGAILLGFCSCNDFLDEKPSKNSQLIPETTDQLEYLLNNVSYEEENNTRWLSTDDYGVVPELFKVRNSIYPVKDLYYCLWNVDDLIQEGSDYGYTTEYTRIYTANLILSYLPQVTGTAETKERLRREALFLRAYSTWNLAQTYCLPYTEANKNEPGLILKKSISYKETAKRATLEETYRMIEADLQEALNTSTELVKNSAGFYRIWRENIPAVNGFAARFYLCMNDYEKALKYANKALEVKSDLMDFNTEMSYSQRSPVVYSKVGLSIYYPKYQDYTTDQACYSHKELYYARLAYVPGAYWIPSKSLMDMYNQQYDLRYKYFFVEDYSYTMTSSNSFLYPGYYYFGTYYIPSGPQVSEMMLIKAECLARSGDVAGAMNVINALRAKRMDKNAPANVINLTASNGQDAVLKVLQERRRELPFVVRWIDLRRLNNNSDSFDDVGDVVKSFYPYSNVNVNSSEALMNYTLSAKSRRYAQPIPQNEIISSGGETQQNTY